jgi:hypothetical protein
MQFTTPMTMMDFFHKSHGTWFTHRTVHHFDLIADESGESNLIVHVLPSDDLRIKDICIQQNIDPAKAAGAASFSWQPNAENQPPNPDQAAVLVDVPDGQQGRSGKLLRSQGYVEKIPVVSRYWFGQDGILTIDTEYDNNQGQERCWFITSDFRVRVSTVRLMSGVSLMTYCSERRCVASDTLQAMLQGHQERTSA